MYIKVNCDPIKSNGNSNTNHTHKEYVSYFDLFIKTKIFITIYK